MDDLEKAVIKYTVLGVIGFLLKKIWNWFQRDKLVAKESLEISPPTSPIEKIDSKKLPKKYHETPTAKDIQAAILEATPFEQLTKGKSFEGLPVEWSVCLIQVLSGKNGTHFVQFQSDNTAGIFGHVSFDQYPQLRLVKPDAAFKIRGIITKVSPYDISLKDVEVV